MTLFELKPELATHFEHHGFTVASALDLTRLTRTDTQSHYLKKDVEALERWIAQNAHGQMHFMAQHKSARTDLNFILENAKSLIIVLAPYAHGKRVRQKDTAQPGQGTSHAQNLADESIFPLVARYARGKDYHKILRKRLDGALADWLKSQSSSEIAFRTIVDTAPFFERSHGQQANLGFVGKSTMLIRPGMGSFFFIASVILTADIESIATTVSKQAPIASLNCGSCRKCLDACPTQALSQDYFLDANKCISYLTIEHRGPVESRYLNHFKNHLYGCDACQDACPYNFSTLDLVHIAEFQTANKALSKISALDVALMTQGDYELWFGGTAMTRAKYEGLVRNAIYHLYATGSEDLKRVLDERRHDVHAGIAATVAQVESLFAAR